MSSIVALIGRVLMSAIFIYFGAMKLLYFPATIGGMNSEHLPLPWAAAIVAVIVELLGGLAILLGIRTRAVAAVLAVYCVVTALVAHAHFDDLNQTIHFMKNICMAGGFLQLLAWGGGRYTATKG
jgi:putative oxidoreductase